MNKRLWLALAIVVAAGTLTAAGLLMRDAGVGVDADTDAAAQAGSTAAVDGDGAQDAGTVNPDAPGAGSSAEESMAVISDAPAGPDDNVSTAIAYELIDTLKANGIEPVPDEALTLEYVERLNRVRVSGKFESDETTSYVLGFANGVWKVEQ